ncbi:uncharacterized protein Z518_10718 [Rhinocladiella mackenziei CBS 650.93]|uniref:NACHT domain-containing protein n=1 Tax=Rhinocladiella mackenziei CBS 650.93 TaxID=1442369 RepID=A0A0D2I955_9EURO|nr:uncharacterized protein Z518_10718 [Rhinocladiella mackenziei CBS 650.93]KIW99790.1 hypothetical protein Z518_10718 [Rhinocladiella mackenziei CBS 650.93]
MDQRPSKTDKLKSFFKPGRHRDSRSPTPKAADSSSLPTDPNVAHNTRDPRRPPQPSAPPAPGSNASLWEKAQKEVENDSGWPEFSAKFMQNGSIVGIDSIISQFQDARSEAEKKKWAISVNGRQFVLRDAVDSIVEYAAVFKDVGVSIAACDPNQNAALAWGIVQFLVTAAVKNKEAHELVGNYKPIAYIMSQCAVYVELYLENKAVSPQTKDSFATSVQDTYTAVLRYLIAAWKFMQQTKFGHSWRAVIKPDSLRSEFDKAEAANSVMLGEQRKAQAQVINDQSDRTRKLEEFIHRLGPSFDQISQGMKDLHDQRQREELKRTQEDVLNKISSYVYHARYTQILQLRMESTCQWILSDPSFHLWRKSDSSFNIWLNGKMGTGKSTIVAFIVEAIMEQIRSEPDSPVRLAYHFCDGTSQQSQTFEYLSVILGSLLKQLCQFPTVEISESLAQRAQNEQAGTLRADECDLFLQQLIMYHPTVIVIDALDEVSQEVCVLLMKTLEHLQAVTTKPVKILISSRPMQRIERLLEKYSKIGVQNQDDINRYIQARLDLFIESSYLDLESAKPRIQRSLRTQAGGMFRWVQMSLQVISSDHSLTSEQDILDLIKNLPPDLGALYERIFEQIESGNPKHSRMVHQSLTLLMYSEFPLITREVIQAVLPVSNFKSPEGFVIDSCKGLVEWDKNQDTFRLAHATVRSFLDTKPGFSFPECHALLAKICLGHLQKQKLLLSNEPPTSWEYRSFTNYAVVCWPWHVLYAFEKRFSDPELREFFPSKPDTPWAHWTGRVAKSIDAHVRRRLMAIRPTESDSDSDSSADPDLAEIEFLENYLQFLDPESSNQPEEPTNTPAEDLVDLVKWKEFRSQPPNPLWSMLYWDLTRALIGPKTTINEGLFTIVREPVWYTRVEDDGSEREVHEFSSMGPPLGIFSQRADFESLKVLIPKVPKPAFDHCRHNPPLSSILENKKLSSGEQEEIFELMLHHGASAKEIDHVYGHTILQKAAELGRTELADLLLRHGADINGSGPAGKVPLLAACQADDPTEMIELLLKRGANPTVVDANGNTALHYLTWNLEFSEDRDYFDVVQSLVDRGVELEAVNEVGRTPLHLAVIDKNVAMEEILLERGASIYAPDFLDRTPVHYAADMGDTDVLEILTSDVFWPEGSAALEIKDALGFTALGLSIYRRNLDTMRILLERGALSHAHISEGDISLLQLALSIEFHAGIALLHTYGAQDEQVSACYGEAEGKYARIGRQGRDPDDGAMQPENSHVSPEERNGEQIDQSLTETASGIFRESEKGRKARQICADLQDANLVIYIGRESGYTYNEVEDGDLDRLREVLQKYGREIHIPPRDEDIERALNWLREDGTYSVDGTKTDSGGENTDDDDDKDENEIENESEDHDEKEEGDDDEDRDKVRAPQEKIFIERTVGCSG